MRHLRLLRDMNAWVLTEISGSELAVYAALFDLPEQDDPLELVDKDIIPSSWKGSTPDGTTDMSAVKSEHQGLVLNDDSKIVVPKFLAHGCDDLQGTTNLIYEPHSSGPKPTDSDAAQLALWNMAEAWEGTGNADSWNLNTADITGSHLTGGDYQMLWKTSQKFPVLHPNEIISTDTLDGSEISSQQLMLLVEQVRRTEAITVALDTNMDVRAKRADERTYAWRAKACHGSSKDPSGHRRSQSLLASVELVDNAKLTHRRWVSEW